MLKRRFGRSGHMSTIAIFGAAAFWEISQADADKVMEMIINLSMVAVVLVVLLVVLVKARVGHGSPLHGGMPSGHAGVACSIATSLAFAAPSLPVLLLGWLLALLVAQSRVLLGVHNYTEVVAGSLLGTGVTVAVHLLFR